MKHYVYIIFSEKKDGFYIGHTKDIDLRLRRHNSGYEKYTRPFVPWKLVWCTEKINKSQAVILESKLKNLNKSRLMNFIQRHN